MPSLTINGQSIFYESTGTGAPLVLIAGLGSSHFLWWKQIQPLSARYRVIALDNRGIGDSAPVSDPFTVADMADDAAALIRALDIGPSHVMGISMGGFIALTLTLRHPELVNKLILCATSAGGASHVPPSDEMLNLLAKSDFPDIATRTRVIYSAVAAPGHMAAHPEDLEPLVRDAEEKPLSVTTYLHQLGAVSDYIIKSGKDQALDGITAPTLVIHGNADPLVAYDNGCYLVAHIKGARLETYEGVGHLPPIEATDRLNSDVMAFLG
jgi:3-oxoadipate enol-lactonase